MASFDIDQLPVDCLYCNGICFKELGTSYYDRSSYT